MVTMGSLYVLIPRLWNRRAMYSTKLINTHFWLATIGTVFYIASMWIAGVMQGLMQRAVDPSDGTLVHPFLVEIVSATHPYYIGRLVGGVIFLSGMLVMAYNVWMTVRGAEHRDLPQA
jgi:cytochrome c oxidase cbb3-type subunit 1